MRPQSKAAQPYTWATLVEEFKSLPAARRHLYFYIFLFLVAVFAQTMKNVTRPASQGPTISVEQE